MFAHLVTGSTPTLALLGVCFLLVLAFEISNGFHETANAVATVIYTHSLKPVQAVVWSAAWNFLGVMLGGIAVAYALVEILPPEVLSPPNGGVAVGMLIALFLTPSRFVASAASFASRVGLAAPRSTACVAV